MPQKSNDRNQDQLATSPVPQEKDDELEMAEEDEDDFGEDDLDDETIDDEEELEE